MYLTVAMVELRKVSLEKENKEKVTYFRVKLGNINQDVFFYFFHFFLFPIDLLFFHEWYYHIIRVVCFQLF